MARKLMKTLVVDDDEVSRKIVSHFVDQTDFLELAGVCSDGIQAGTVIRNEKIDIVFLDIEMPGMDGMELLESLKDAPQMVLITSQEQYALQAFEHAVTDYLLKPVSYGRFLKAAQRAYEKFDEINENSKYANADGQDLFVKVNSQLIKVDTNDINWIEARGDYVTINMKDENVTVHSTMKGIEQKLPGNQFMRAHRSFIVNTRKIKLIDEGMLIIADKLIPIGPNYKDKLIKKLNRLQK